MQHVDPIASEPLSRSKSQRKRDAIALQKFAESLLVLSSTQRASLALPSTVEAAVTAAAAMKKGAYRRQIRYIAGLLRATEVGAIETALKQLRGSGIVTAAAHKRSEYWRDQLIESGDSAVAALIADHPSVDRTQLRQLVRNARREPPESVKAARMLYRFVRALEGG